VQYPRSVTFCLQVVAALFSLFTVSSTFSEERTSRNLISSGDLSNRINFVFLSEGYTTAQETNFFADAQRAGVAILRAKPFKVYTNFFNVLGIFVASAESGSDHPSRNLYRDTYFNSRYDSAGASYRISVPPNESDTHYEMGLGKVNDLLAQFGLSSAVPILLVNDPEYGGSGGSITIASTHSTSAALVLHELGHSFAFLWEEYEGTIYGAVNTVNNTAKTNLADIPWNRWINPSTPIPTPERNPYANVIGLFEGAGGFQSGTYRPKFNCRMRSIDAEFCEVCSEALILSFYKRIAVFDAWNPIAAYLTIPSGSIQRFEFLKVPAHPDLSVQWYIDGSPATNWSSFLFDSRSVSIGDHIVSAVAQDRTPMVRYDPFNVLHDERQWWVTVSGPLIQYSSAGSALTLVWFEGANRFVLQRSHSLGAGAIWDDVSGAIVENGTALISLSLKSDQQFFRLRPDTNETP
jgi:hypothetical protein